MKLDIIKAARLLGMSEEMLLRWARQGKIPAEKRRGTYWIGQEDLKTWARRHNVPITSDRHENQDSGNGPVEVSLFHAMNQGGVFFDIPGDDVRSALDCATALIKLPGDLDRTVLLDELLQRESLASTGIGNGVAIPHPRYPMEKSPRRGLITTCYLENEIDFSSLDGKPIFLFFIMISPSTERHLKMLSRLSYCLRDSDFFSFLRSCKTSEGLLSMVQKMERKLANEQGKGD